MAYDSCPGTHSYGYLKLAFRNVSREYGRSVASELTSAAFSWVYTKFVKEGSAKDLALDFLLDHPRR